MSNCSPTLGIAVAMSGTGFTQESVEQRLQRLEQDNEELKLRLDAVTSDLERFEFGDIFPRGG